jgi:uncharacterized membrane protein YdjX (TVP38/TMEM64 family)/Fe-S oxidoreductase
VNKNIKKIIILAVIALVVAAYFLLDLNTYLTLENIKSSREEFSSILEERPFAVLGVFLAIYLSVVSLNLPGALPLGLLAGAIFGALAGTIIISFASTIGATIACFLARYLIRDWVRNRFTGFINTVDKGIKNEGAFYLFSLRMIPVIPFFAINMIMGVTSMPLKTFFWVSQLGMLPGTFVFVNAGSQLGRIESAGDILSPGLIISFVLIGLFPLVAKKLISLLRKRYGAEKTELEQTLPLTDPLMSFAPRGAAGPELAKEAQKNLEACTECGICETQCLFLEKYGSPGRIAKDILEGKEMADPFECSLCDHCGAICPEKVEPVAMFLAMRRQSLAEETVNLSRYKPLLKYESTGHSNLFIWYPSKKCKAVFFPGCTLPGTRPDTTWKLFLELKKLDPDLEMVLDCCHKPSHDLGRQNYFDERFQAITSRLKECGVSEILVACPNCYKVFSNYGQDFQVKTVYQILAENNVFQPVSGAQQLVIHDPCPLRYQDEIQASVRSLLDQSGFEIKKIKKSGKKTICCGEGGAVGFHNPGFARAWGEKRRKLAGEDRIVTYCAGCAGFLGRSGKVSHLGDILFDPEKALAGKSRVSGTPATYLNRLLLKRKLKRGG